jgi:hypothetical protein
MRTTNIAIMFSFAAISALLGVFSLITGINNYPNSLAATASLTGLLIISLAYGLLALGGKEKSGKLHFLTLALYVISAILGVIASSNIGLVPYIMHSMNLGLIPALSYVVPVLPICATVSIAAYIAARICIQRNKTDAIPAPGASA